MFRQFFSRKGNEDDGVHRMALRSGGQALPDDPDEIAYAADEGEHAQLARDALHVGDLRRSIYHLALALADDPEREEWLTLLDQWIATAGSHALELVPLYDKAYFTTVQASKQLMHMGNKPDHRMEVIPVVGQHYHAKVAVHAYILMTQGKTKEGVTLLLQLAQVKPEIPYITWLMRWHNQPGFVEALDLTKLAMSTAQCMQKYPGTYIFSADGRKELNRYVPLLHLCYQTFAQKPQQEGFFTLAFTYASILRKTGAFEEAASIARTSPPSYQTCVPLAMAEGALGNFAASVAAYRKALTFDPRDVAVRNDLGELYLVHGNLNEALHMYEESVRLDPGDPFQRAYAHIAYLRYLQTPSSEHLQALQKLASRMGEAQRLLYLVQFPYTGKLPQHAEALTNLMRRLKTDVPAGKVRMPSDKTLTVALTALEAPSALLAARRMLASWDYALDLTVSEVLTPDPRLPLCPVEYHIWRYEGHEPIPAVPASDPTIGQSIAELARTPYNLLRWYTNARTLARQLGDAALMDLLGVMVHPPITPVGWDEWDWLTAVQLASVLTIASLNYETPWENSQRKSALLSLIYGPTDWSGAAALMALAVLAAQNTRIAIEFDAICRDLWHHGGGTPEWPHEQAIVAGLMYVNQFSDESRRIIQQYFERQRKERHENG